MALSNLWLENLPAILLPVAVLTSGSQIQLAFLVGRDSMITAPHGMSTFGLKAFPLLVPFPIGLLSSRADPHLHSLLLSHRLSQVGRGFCHVILCLQRPFSGNSRCWESVASLVTVTSLEPLSCWSQHVHLNSSKPFIPQSGMLAFLVQFLLINWTLHIERLTKKFVLESKCWR